MKNLNRNLYLIIVGIAEILFFTYAMVLYRRGIIDTFHFQMGCIFAGGVGVLAVILAFSKHSWFGKNNDGDFNPALIEVPHTLEGIVFEVLTGLIIVCAWVLALATDRFWIIEGFFSFLSPVLMFVLSILAITFSWIVYLPGFKSKLRGHNVKQVAIEIRMCRVLAIGLALIAFIGALPLGDFLVTSIYIIGAVFLATVAIFRYLIYKARNTSAGIKLSDTHNETTDGFDIDEVKVHRTALDTAIEVLTGVLIVSAWVVAAINGLFTEDDGIFCVRELFHLLTFTVCSILMLRSAHRPLDMEKDVRVTMTNLKQVKLAATLHRLAAVLIALVMLFSSFPRFHGSSWPWIGMFAIALILLITFRILIRRARD